MAKHNRSILARKAKIRRLKAVKAGKKPKTLLTGKIEPIPDLLTLALKRIEVQSDLIAKLSKIPKAKVAAGNLAMGDIAITILIKHPDWSVEDIAKEMDVVRNTPYKWKRFMTAFRLQKEENKRIFEENLPMGSKPKKSRKVEAWEKKKRQDENGE